MDIGFVQFFPVFGGVARNIARVVQLIRGQKGRLWVLPELFATGYEFRDRAEVMALAEGLDGPTIRTMTDQARRNDCYFCGGWPELDGDRVYNSAFLVGPEGLIQAYRKVHLFDREKLLFDPGDRGFAIAEVDDVKVGMMICFDWIFPESARTLAMLGAEVILHPANLVLPHCPSSMPTRCIENQVYSVTANRIGREKRTDRELHFIGSSLIVAPDGEVLQQTGQRDEVARIARIKPERSRNKQITPNNHLLNDRITSAYRLD